MKRNLLIMSLLLVGISFLASCSDDDDDKTPSAVKEVLSISDAAYNEGTFPTATTNVVVSGASVTAGTVKIAKNDNYRRIFIGVKGMEGYYVYTPDPSTRAADDDEFWTIPFNYGGTASDVTLLISAETENGSVTKPSEFTLNYTDTPSSAMPVQITMNGKAWAKFQYDSKNRLTEAKINEEPGRTYPYSTLVITYKNDKVTKLEMGGYDSEKESEVMTFTSVQSNSQGYITSMSGTTKESWDGYTYKGTVSFTCAYDNDGYLIRLQESWKDEDGTDNYTTTFTWSDGNLVRRTDSDGGVITVTYGDKLNEAGQGTYGQYASGLAEICFAGGLFGKLSKNLPTSVTEDGETSKLSYDFNDDGTISCEYVNGVPLVYTYGSTK